MRRPLIPLGVLCLIACGGPGPADELDGGGGPPGGRLRFDAAMLAEADAWVAPEPLDSGVPRPDSGRPDPIDAGLRCTGVATPCSLVSTASCRSQQGCRVEGDCDGLASSCYYLNRYQCIDQEGCYWSSLSERCSGSARSCSLFSSSFSCSDQRGCSWDERCAGVETPCSLLSNAECTLQQGCRLQ